MDSSDVPNEEGVGPKPTPIREVVGEPRPNPRRRADEPHVGDSPEQRARGQRERPKGSRDKGRSVGRGRDRGQGRTAPRSVRAGLDGQASKPTAVQDLPSREFVSEGVEWILRLSGRSSTGSPSDPGAPLLHLMFYRADEPLVEVCEALIPGDSIDRLFEADLAAVVESARKATMPEEPSKVPPTPSPSE